MDSSKVDAYIISKSKYFEPHQIPAIKQKLIDLPEEEFIYVQSLNIKDPTIMLVISLVGGSLGVDRFIMGDVGLGILKLITCGGAGIWTIVDWFLVMGKTREMNFQKLIQITG